MIFEKNCALLLEFCRVILVYSYNTVMFRLSLQICSVKHIRHE